MGAGASGAVPPKTGGGSSSSSSNSSNNNSRYNVSARAGSHPLGSAKAGGGGTGIDDGLLRSKNKNDTTGNKVFLYIIFTFC